MNGHIDVRTIQQFDANGQVWRAFDNLIARRYGTVLMVPIQLTIGSMASVIDRCPLPIEEVVAILDAGPLRNTAERPNDLPIMRLLTAFAPPAEWEVDHVHLGTVGHPKIRRLLHAQTGMRYAEPIMDDPDPERTWR